MKSIIIALAFQLFTSPSPTCIQVIGKTTKERDNALDFCAKGVKPGLVVGVMVNETLVYIKVTRLTVDAFQYDRLTAEQIVLNWMKAWKAYSGSKVITVYVEWGDVEIARGETTIFNGDQVTIKRN